MALSVFYSWQSDRPFRTNHDFIEDALRKALERFHREGLENLEEADRPSFSVDRDTQGVPGQPAIFDTILQKIRQCAIFVPDLTFVGETSEGRYLPNPNVLIEYGFAIGAIGRTRVIAVMNDAFGDPTELPFDMRHARHPIRYTLTEDTDNEAREEAKRALAEELARAIREIFESGALQKIVSEKEAFQSAQPTVNDSTFFLPDDVAIVIGRPKGDPIRCTFSRTRNLFLRVLPRNRTEPLIQADAERMVNRGQLSSFCAREGDPYSGRNKYGAVAARVHDSEVLAFTQLFLSRELWGVDGAAFDGCRQKSTSGKDFLYLPSTYLEEDAYTPSLKCYILFAKHHLRLEPPLRFIAGATEIEGFRMALRHGFSESEVIQPSIIYEGEILSYDDDPQELLLPFYKKLWDAVGLERPEDQR